MTIYSATKWPTNSHLINSCMDLGYITGKILDPTFGLGNWWKICKPELLTTGDLYTSADVKLDFRHLPFADRTFDTVTYDGPYKLNGTPSAPDIAYGVGTYTDWKDRLILLIEGQIECARVVKKGGHLLTKCMDQVVSGKVRFQSDILTNTVVKLGMRKVDELLFLTDPRPQPHVRQVHSRRNYSTLMVFERIS